MNGGFEQPLGGNPIMLEHLHLAAGEDRLIREADDAKREEQPSLHEEGCAQTAQTAVDAVLLHRDDCAGQLCSSPYGLGIKRADGMQTDDPTRDTGSLQ